jgi:ABC-type Fe3+-hydroxamate transport system substrate-binding protein
MNKGTFVDQLKRDVRLKNKPNRIVSLVPSLTEFLHFLGLEDEVVGITKFCIHPKIWFEQKERVGGTKRLNIDKIKALEPDLIIGNKEENTKEDISALEKFAPVWMSDVNSFEDAIEMINQLGIVLSKEQVCLKLVDDLKIAYSDLKNLGKNLAVLYFIWDKPSFVAGRATFIDSIIQILGFNNIAHLERYPDIDALGDCEPHYVFLSSEPFPFEAKHLQKYQSRFPSAKIILVDGEMFSWYGSRMLLAADYFQNKLKEML